MTVKLINSHFKRTYFQFHLISVKMLVKWNNKIIHYIYGSLINKVFKGVKKNIREI